VSTILGLVAGVIILAGVSALLATNQWPWQWGKTLRASSPATAVDLQCPECLWWAPTPEARDAHQNIEHRKRGRA
jgi:hypothetical protein